MTSKRWRLATLIDGIWCNNFMSRTLEESRNTLRLWVATLTVRVLLSA